MSLSALPEILEIQSAQSTPVATSASGLIGPVGLELRQVSGLGAGAARPIPARGITYTGGRNQTGFRLDADADGEFVLTPLGAAVRLDDRLVTTPTVVGLSVIELGHAGFVVAQRRRLPGGKDCSRATTRRRIGPVRGDLPPQAESVVKITGANPTDAALTAAVAKAHRRAIDERRFAWPNPEEIIHQALDDGARLWSRTASHPLFGQVAVAHGSLPWHATLERTVQVSTRCQGAMSTFQTLPAVPIVADLTQGPLGIVGERQRALAVARATVLALTTLSPPSDLRLAIQTSRRTSADWAWADKLPHLGAADLVGTSAPAHLLTVSDLPNRWGELGSIIVTDDVGKLPDSCDDVVIVGNDGTCTVLDHRSELMTIGASPLGLADNLATVAAAALAGTAASTRFLRAEPAPRRRGRFTGMVRELAMTTRPNRTDFRRPPIGSAPTQHGYESSFF